MARHKNDLHDKLKRPRNFIDDMYNIHMLLEADKLKPANMRMVTGKKVNWNWIMRIVVSVCMEWCTIYLR